MLVHRDWTTPVIVILCRVVGMKFECTSSHSVFSLPVCFRRHALLRGVFGKQNKYILQSFWLELFRPWSSGTYCHFYIKHRDLEMEEDQIGISHVRSNPSEFKSGHSKRREKAKLLNSFFLYCPLQRVILGACIFFSVERQEGLQDASWAISRLVRLRSRTLCDQTNAIIWA